MNRPSEARFCSAAALLIGLTAGWAFERPASADVAFAPAQSYAVGDGPIDVTVADVDGDGALDVVSSNSHSGDLSLLINNGDGTLAPEIRLDPGGAPQRAAVGDIDGDGDEDVVATITGPGTIAVFLTESAGVFAPAVQYGTATFSFVLAMTDVDNDEDLDVAVVMPGVPGVSVSVFRNAGDGTFLPAEAYAAFEATIVYAADLAAADVDGDGWTDLVVVNDCPVGCDAAVAILINAGDGTFLAPSPVDLDITGAGSVRVDDLDGDGDVDVVIGCSLPGGDLLIAVNDGTGAFSELSRSPTDRSCSVGSVTTPDGIALLDVDADGAPDAVLPSMIDDEVRVLLNRGDLTFEAPIALAVGERPIAVANGDLDGDGRDDIVTADRAIEGTPTVTVLINRTPRVCPADLDDSGDVGFSDILAVIGAWGACGAPCPEDLSGNGSVDFADILAVIGAWGACP